MFKRISFNKLETEAIKLSLRGYFNTFIFITRDTTVTAGNNTDDAFTNCAVFSTFKSENNDLFKQPILLNVIQNVLSQIFEIILTHLF